ncbi:flotillin family protein [Mucilaginibacter paludis]|uniref:Uncharacterized protein n=1 Tax=Mucilaginibacter paludis DSM 18603 TaxID=714943 RepID=H1Y5P3_9SPHI|nr:hypothetical protein [Mucilaginibacter paludis]EHQ29819.1 hypothetical protein Mucpa_5751 [Mucilaginibacter paludis DSM 18603]
MRIVYNPNDVSREIASHDNFKHFHRDGKKWAKHGIHFEIGNFEKHVAKVLSDKETVVRAGLKSRDFYYSEKYKSTVIVDYGGKDKGTCYYTKNKNNFNNIVLEDNKQRKLLKLQLPKELKGGHKALYDLKSIRKKERQLKNNFKTFNKTGPNARKHRATKTLEKKIKRNSEKNKNQYKAKEKLADRKLKIEQNKQKQAQARLQNERKKVLIAELHKKKEQDARLKLEAQKKKEAAIAKEQAIKNAPQKSDEMKKNEQKKQLDIVQQEALEREQARQRRLRELEEARLQNQKDITKGYHK